MRIAIVGGYGHQSLLKAVEAGTAELVGIASDGYDDEAQRKYGKKDYAQGVKYWENYGDMLDKVQPDVVSVGAVYGYNGEVVAEALGRQMHAVSDKPIAGTWDQLEAIQEELDHGMGLHVLTEFFARCWPAWRAGRLAMEAGMIGEPVLVTSQKSYKFKESRPAFYRDRSLYTGSIQWIGAKGVDSAYYIGGQKFAKVFGHQGNLSQPDYGTMEDHVSVLYGLENGGTGVMHCDYLRPNGALTHGDDRVRVAGTKGLLEVSETACILTTHDQKPTDITEMGAAASVEKDFVEALEGKTDVYSTEHSMYLAKVMLHSRDAADEGKVVEIS